MLNRRDREILRLAVPAFLALVAEPLFLLADAAIIGHVGTAELAGLGVAAVVLQTIVGLCVFLAYGTTAAVARQLGAGDLRTALTQGVDGLWLAVAIGAVATVLGVALTGPLVGAFGAGATVTGHAEVYLRISLLSTIPVLLMLAATGVLRGLQDVRTPVIVAVVGNLANIGLNFVLVYGWGPVPALGLPGAAIGSVIVQTACGAALVSVVARAARRHGARLRPDLGGVRAAGRAGMPLVVRTLTLRAALLVTTYAVTVTAIGDEGPAQIAAHQLALTLWSFLAFVLDAIAIAAQALTGRSLGAGDIEGTRATTRRMVQWGLGTGVVTGLGIAALSPFAGALFTPDPAVHALLVPALLVIALAQPLAGVVFVLDGVLIGAGDGRYLAWGGVVVLSVYAPVVGFTALAAPSLTAIWVAMAFVFMGARAAVLLHRSRGTAWMVVGA